MQNGASIYSSSIFRGLSNDLHPGWREVLRIWFCDHVGTGAIWHGTFLWPSAENFPRFEVSEHTYFYAKGVFQALLTSESHRIQVVPVMFPLPFSHALPIGQIFSPQIGSLTFWKTIVDMAGNQRSGYV